jgi:hypothetical protein
LSVEQQRLALEIQLGLDNVVAERYRAWIDEYADAVARLASRAMLVPPGLDNESTRRYLVVSIDRQLR